MAVLPVLEELRVASLKSVSFFCCCSIFLELKGHKSINKQQCVQKVRAVIYGNVAAGEYF